MRIVRQLSFAIKVRKSHFFLLVSEYGTLNLLLVEERD